MRYTYKVRELSKDIVDNVTNEVGNVEEMQAMSLKKLQSKLDHKKEYHVEYTNKKGNFISTIITGRENK